MSLSDESKGNLGDIEGLLATLPEATWESQLSLDNTDRALLQRLLRLTQALQQGNGSTTRSATSSPMSGNTTLYGQSHAEPPTSVQSMASEDFSGRASCDETYDLSDSWDYAHDGRSSKTGTPSTDGGDTVVSQTRPHAAVEKRYRRTVNTKLSQLHASIPASGKFTPIRERTNQGSESGDAEQAAKHVVLDKAIQYITHLISTYRGYEDDIQQLRQQIRELLDDETDDQCNKVRTAATACDSQGPSL